MVRKQVVLETINEVCLAEDLVLMPLQGIETLDEPVEEPDILEKITDVLVHTSFNFPDNTIKGMLVVRGIRKVSFLNGVRQTK